MNSNKLNRQLNEYLDYKHSLGFKLEHEECVLRNFAAYTLAVGYMGSLTCNIVLDWIASSSKSDKTKGRKLEVIRPFSKYISAFDPDAESIPNKLFHNVHSRPEPYIYTETEVITLMDACESLFSPDGIRSRSVKYIIGLLWSTGMRPSEPINLRLRDIEFEKQIIIVRETKFAKERLIPVTNSVIQKIIIYKDWLESAIGKIYPDDQLFRTTFGKPMTERALAYAFKTIRHTIHAVPKGYPDVRLYDFRHTFACNTILKWLKTGQDANAMMYTLSTFLGHAKIQDTYWYLSATQDLLNHACSRYEERFGGVDID
ncbi:tyrosine-type recombinase/integrase [Ruminococcus sp.]|jgi:integrase|uniref:tyrosine-type recombinase/integrase n=1 Tax=Ruminococcus sp. TaxID=41978 RepID=UPI0025DE8615|nr:tyrosine-type recombinase/integrase [Ruminococcus sp.]